MRKLLLIKMFWVWLLPVAIAQQQVSGTVTDYTSGEALPGVNILIQGTTTGTITDMSGNYSLSVPSGDVVLVFSFIGYETQEVTVGSQTNISLGMMPDLTTLSEVVVIGYGTQRAEAVTGSVASISGDVMRDVPSSNITQSLQGRLPGVEFTQTNSKPGAATQIRVRGTRSLTASNDPLVVLDGIPFAG